MKNKYKKDFIKMKYVIKVENLTDLPLTNPLMAMDNNKQCAWVPKMPNNEIWYKSSNGQVVTPNRTTTLPPIVSNTYSNGKGIIKFVSNITSIGSYAFLGCSGLSSVTIPNSVTNIRNQAFYNCSGLTSVAIPNSVTSIGDRAFSGCTSLSSVTIPNSVTSFENSAFSGCTSLTSVTIPNSVTSIREGAFSGCTSLTSVTIPNSVTSIRNSAFYHCTSLTSVTIPNSVTSIEGYAFEGCSGLTSIEYGGYRKDWYKIQLGTNWNGNIPCERIQCLDGYIDLHYYDIIGVFDEIE